MSYFELFDTSGLGGGRPYNSGADEDAIDDAVAEGVAAKIVEEAEAAAPTDSSGYLDTGALALNLQGLLQAPQKLLQGMLGMNIPQAKAQKIIPLVQKKVVAKVQAKAAAPRPAALALHMPPRPPAAPAPQFHPGMLAPGAFGQHHGGQGPRLLSFAELLDRLQVRQLANYSGLITAGDSIDVQVRVTRNGTVLNWSNSDAADDIIVKRVLYGQDTSTVYNDQTLGAWSSKALNKVPVDPIEVTMPNVFDATLENPTADDIRVVWTMWGLSNKDAANAMRDRDVAYTLQHRGIPIALQFANAFPS